MSIAEMTAREARSITPSRDLLTESFDYLIQLGWRPQQSSRHDYGWGWWIHPLHETKNRPVGDAKQIHYAAWDTLKAYVLPETN